MAPAIETEIVSIKDIFSLSGPVLNALHAFARLVLYQ